MTLLEKKESHSILKKHVNTIHCSNNLTLVQRKLFNALLFNAYHEIPERSQYEIPVKNLCGLIGYDSRDYKKLRKSILDLVTTAIEWNVIENDKGEQKERWRASSIVSSAEIENGLCKYEFSSVMRELLYKPEIYGKIDIKLMTQFKSSYGLALYENCIRFQSVSSTPLLPISTFRKLMGIEDGRYQNFCDLKKRVLDIAVKEVNLYSPLTVIPEIKRVNKSVTGIKFKFVEKQELMPVKSRLEEYNDDLFNIMKRDFALSEKMIFEVLDRYNSEFIQEKINIIKSSASFKVGKIRELAAYFMDALKRDYKPNKSSKALASEVRYQEEMKTKAEKKKQEQDYKLDRDRKLSRITEYLDNLSEKERENTYQVFEQMILNSGDPFMIKKYHKYGLKDISVVGMFNSYILDKINKKYKEGFI